MSIKKYADSTGLTEFWAKVKTIVNEKQDTLVSGTNIKTVNNETILGSGNITIGGSSAEAVSITLLSSGWSNNEQIATVTGVTSSSSVIISPAPTDMDAYTAYGIKCIAQSADSLTFTCDDVPSTNILVNILIL